MQELYLQYLSKSIGDWKDKHPGEIIIYNDHFYNAQSIMLEKHGLKKCDFGPWDIVDKDKFLVTTMSLEIK